MGVLRSDQGETVSLWGDHLIGRAPDAALRINEESVSWRHASLRWTGTLWELQDLGSLNGTFVDGKRLESGHRMPLRSGTRLRFGASAANYVLTDAGAPAACVVSLDTGEHVPMMDGMIALPTADAPEVTLYQAQDGKHMIEDATGARELAENLEFEVGGQRYRFEPGSSVFATMSPRGGAPVPANLSLEFRVSRNEEHVEIDVLFSGQRWPLRPRAHSYMLLTLARHRLEDQQDDEIPFSDQGWIDQDELLRMLATTPQQLALDIFRARRQFGDAGVVDAPQIIERRPDSHEVRIGVARLQVETS